MAKYRIDAEVSVDDGPWEPDWSSIENSARDLPTARQAAWQIKDSIALVQTGHDLSRVKVRNVRVTNLEQ